jgi:hypothetical protein
MQWRQLPRVFEWPSLARDQQVSVLQQQSRRPEEK